MALFFDHTWFDAQLRLRGATRLALGAVLGIDAQAVEEIFKDQRELKAKDVSALAGFFGVSTQEIAHRAGVSTPVPVATPATLSAMSARIDALHDDVLRVERLCLELKALILEMRTRP